MRSKQQLQILDYDYIIIGSGFGGSVSAMRLSEKGYKVCVLERGKRFYAKDYARSNWELRKYLWMPLLKCFGIQNLSLFKNVLILSGTGVGGGSLVYANTLIVPPEKVFKSFGNSSIDWHAELKPFYAKAQQMLGVTQNPHLTDVDYQLKEVAKQLKRDHTFNPAPVGVFFGKPGEEGKTVEDPFFEGKGPERAGCTLCGGCMVGCRHNAKNTLDKNYLYFAERNGAVVLPECNVTNIRPKTQKNSAGVNADGSCGYEVDIEQSTAWFFKRPKTLRARSVIVSAGVLGTLSLLLKCRDQTKTLPRLSAKLGDQVRTNSEALIGVTTQDTTQDFSKGIAITSGFYADEDTHVEPVRYSAGSSFMKLLATPMVDDGNRITRPLKLLAAIFFHPWQSIKLAMNRRWAESTIILLVMQNLDNRMKFRLGRNLFTLFRKRLTTAVDPSVPKVPSYIPLGHQVARMLAKRIQGIPQSAINEVVLQIPTTAHILGGCAIGTDSQNGVIDDKHQVFGYKNLYVCDGSVIPANLGVNPSLTITAMTERCMSFIPNR